MEANISLNCSMRNRYEVSWYHLRAKRFNLLISAQTGITGREFLTTYNQNLPRLKITADTRITTATLVISGVTESDVGLYFCGTKSDTTEMHFDPPIRLEIEGQHAEDPYTELPVEDSDNTDGVTVTERVLMYGGVGLAVFVFFVATVVAGGIIHHRGWQKGWAAAKRSSHQRSVYNHKTAK
ncbi:Carnitine operon protein CaiE [Labeo rohita]|uniref:Carnitine operon protein CaiE n=1 Tax=Labeo rohita TaxID=84645 RepID=A0ABQ8LAT0_LABRO|nr:Carnitine operon protein CaiE [Labeo rohita]